MSGVDDTGFQAFFHVQYERLRWLGYLLSGDWAQAEDLAQDALTRTYWRWRLVARGNPAAYTRKVLVNRYRSLMRRAVVERRFLEASRPEADATLPERHEDLLALRAAVRALPPKQRLMVVLRYHEDLSEAEVARLLHMPVGTVKSTTHRALAKLRRGLDSAGPTLKEGMRR